MAGKVGIKETKEALVGTTALTAVIIYHLNDGLQVGKDALAVFNDMQNNEEVKKRLLAAADGIKKVPNEVQDIQAEEGVDLASTVLAEVPSILKALRGDHPFTAKVETPPTPNN